MIQIRKSEDRGHFDHGWLNTYHSFSFSEYYDEKHMGFRHLRVINEDFVAAGDGFDMHPHKDMEIVTYIMEGALKHQDSMGNGSIIRPGDVQRMSAGTGVLHSEFNASQSEQVHLLQIWILPEKKGIAPGYEQKSIPTESRKNTLKLIASREGNDGAVLIHQDAKIYASNLDSGKVLTYEMPSSRYAWVQLVHGELELNGVTLSSGDGAAITNETKISLRANQAAEFLLFDLS